nr:MAG TPA: hypothetical protein [Caudoviricetes sp.]
MRRHGEKLSELITFLSLSPHREKLVGVTKLP